MHFTLLCHLMHLHYISCRHEGKIKVRYPLLSMVTVWFRFGQIMFGLKLSSGLSSVRNFFAFLLVYFSYHTVIHFSHRCALIISCCSCPRPWIEMTAVFSWSHLSNSTAAHLHPLPHPFKIISFLPLVLYVLCMLLLHPTNSSQTLQIHQCYHFISLSQPSASKHPRLFGQNLVFTLHQLQ